MISFANTAWEVFSLAAIFILGLALVPALCRLLGVPTRHGLALYLWHSVFCVVYIIYSLDNRADSIAYFTRSLSWDLPPALGTRFVIFFNSLLTQGLQLSYGGAFFVYNILGSIGLLAFSAALRDAVKTKTRYVRKLVTLLPFLPGFSFWSTAIGKDSIAFFAVGLICWAAASPQRRLYAILVGFIAMLLVRPHMAGFLMIALAISFSLASEGSFKLKLLINSIVLPTAVAVVILSISYIGLNENFSANSLSSYFEQRQSYNTEGGSSVDIANASVPMRLFMYAFQPLFFDASGAFGLIVSAENMLLLILALGSLTAIVKRRSSLTRFQRILFLLYVALSWLVLANTTANLGIAIRQKTMFTPMLLLLILSYRPNLRHSTHPQPLNSP